MKCYTCELIDENGTIVDSLCTSTEDDVDPQDVYDAFVKHSSGRTVVNFRRVE